MKLNADIGEGFGEDTQLLEVIHQANIGLGEHAGNWDLTVSTAQMARENGVEIGLHPGFPDRESMGRRAPPHNEEEKWIDSLIAQCYHSASEIPDACYIKPHGAAYAFLNPSHHDVVDCFRSIGLPLMGIPGTGIEQIAVDAQVEFIAEGFAERGYSLGYSGLIPRNEPGAELHDINQMVNQIQALLGMGIRTFCIHGDRPGAGKLARNLREACERVGIEFC